MTAGIHAVVMAAGAGRRMGCRPKALLRRDGESLLARQLRLLGEVGVRRTVVVLGHHAAALSQALATLPVAPGEVRSSVVNPTPDAGPGTSLRCALAALPDGAAATLVLLGDQPLLEHADLQAMLAAWARRAPGVELVLPQHAGQPGHPVVFGPPVRQAVLQATGAYGVRDWRRGHPWAVGVLDVDHARCTTDLDTPQDIARVAQAHGISLQWPDDLRQSVSTISGTIAR
ncbi:NTP transferase domain-containing protein [Comamonas faecalis]|uniref:NTP transferase domain-containing protein n=1 Tax=Comamonas faecalis TaxID=1387849 RepID=A0ABP7RIK9_9BURK